MSTLDVSKLKVTELRAELSQRNLPTKGKKDELVARLKEALEAEPKEEDASKTKEETKETEEKTKDTKENPEESDAQMEEAQPVEQIKDTTVETDQQMEDSKVETETKEKPAETPQDQSDDKKERVETKEEPAKDTNKESTKETVDETSNETAKELTNNAAKDKETAKEAAQESTKDEVKKPVEKTTKTTDTTKESAEETVQEITKDEFKQTTKYDIQEITKDEFKETAKDEVGNKRKRSVAKGQEDKRPKIDDGITSSAIYVKNFVRPLIVRQAQEMFSTYGTVKRFWMDSIKTHAYIIYENQAQAQEAYDKCNGLKYPPETGKKLSVGGLTPEQAEQLITYEQNTRVKVDWEAAIYKVKSGEELPVTTDGGRRQRSIGIGQVAKQLAAQAAPATTREEVQERKKDVSLDDLFRKTKALPHLYYLPNK